jgi:hypothetical protein
MKTTLSSQYPQFTPEERLRLLIAAKAREDQPEVHRLLRSCPQMPLVGADPQFTMRVLGMHAALSQVTRLWVEVSAFVLGTALLVGSLPRKDRAGVAKATATRKRWSAAWRGIESGIMKFCTEAKLPCDQLLVLANGRSPLVEGARSVLHDDARADRQREDVTLRMLRQAWEGRPE